jgi:hypothetical protein
VWGYGKFTPLFYTKRGRFSQRKMRAQSNSHQRKKMEAERQEESKLHPHLSVEEKLYFGSVVVSFVAVGGASFAYVPNESFAEGNPNDEVLKKISIDRLQPAYSNLILPAIPAVDVVPISTDNKRGTRLCFAHMMVPRPKAHDRVTQHLRPSCPSYSDSHSSRAKKAHPWPSASRAAAVPPCSRPTANGTGSKACTSTLFRLCATRRANTPYLVGRFRMW